MVEEIPARTGKMGHFYLGFKCTPVFLQIKHRKGGSSPQKGNKKTLCECLFGRIEWTRPSASGQVNLQRAKRADRKVVRTAKPQLCCAKGEHNQVHKKGNKKKHSVSVCLVGLSGLEPPTPTLSGWCSNLLSYNPIVCGGDTRIRTEDLLNANQALYQLSYIPT